MYPKALGFKEILNFGSRPINSGELKRITNFQRSRGECRWGNVGGVSGNGERKRVERRGGGKFLILNKI